MNPTWRRRAFVQALVVPVALPLLAGCALIRPRPHYVPVADALTSPTLREGIRVAPQRFSLTEMVRNCPDSRRVDHFRTVRPLQLQVGERFPLALLVVLAVDEDDRPLPDIPISLEVDEREPPVLLLRSGDPDISQGLLQALGPGSFRIRIRTLCSPPADTAITGRVSAPRRFPGAFRPRL
jgi:hypothetical protein